MFTPREWKRLYTDGTVVKWLQQVSDFFIAEGRIANPVPAADYLDSSLYLAEVK